MTDDLLLPGLKASTPVLPEVSNEPVAGNLGETEAVVEEAAKVEEVDPKAEFREIYKSLVDAAHASLDGQDISNAALTHKYWTLMNEARQYAHLKGL